MKAELAIVNRVFTKRETEKSNWSGRIGSVEFSIDAPSKGNVTFHVDGKEIPDTSALYLMTFALQSLQDAYAGADSLDEATANFDKKLAALLDGTIGVRGSGGGLSDEERAEAYVAEQAVREKVSADEWKAMSDDAKAERVAKAIATLKEKRADVFAAKVAERVAHVVEQRKRRAAEKAAIASMADIDL